MLGSGRLGGVFWEKEGEGEEGSMESQVKYLGELVILSNLSHKLGSGLGQG